MDDLEVLVLGEEYRAGRERLTALVAEAPAATWDLPVAACPGWSVRGVVSHLLGTVEDALAGPITGPPPEELTAEQVARHAGAPGAVLLARWAELSPPFEDVVTAGEIVPAVMDVVSHEHDVRHALGAPAGRDAAIVGFGARRLVAGLTAPWTWVVEMEDGEVVRSADGGGPTHRLRATAFEVFRLRLGRRAPEEVAALDWGPAPPADLSPLFVFGPRTTPLAEGP